MWRLIDVIRPESTKNAGKQEIPRKISPFWTLKNEDLLKKYQYWQVKGEIGSFSAAC